VDFVVQEMPHNIWIRDVKVNLVDDQAFTLTGNALTMQVVGDFLQKLQPGSFFNSWSLVETRKLEPSKSGSPNEAVNPEEKDLARFLPPDSKSFEITAKVVTP
jgi:hypothetical protein